MSHFYNKKERKFLMKSMSRNLDYRGLEKFREVSNQKKRPYINNVSLKHFMNQPKKLKGKKEKGFSENRDLKDKEDLINAVVSGDFKKVEGFLKEGHDPNTQDRFGNTLLHKALDKENLEMIKLLLFHGSNPDIKNDRGDSVLHQGVRYSNTNSLRILIPASKDVNALNKNGFSCLHIAVVAQNQDMVNLLLESKLDPNLLDRTKNAPLHMAIAKRNPEILESLLKNGADPNLHNAKGETPLSLVVQMDEKILFKKLLENGANPNQRDGLLKFPPLYHAINRGNLEFAEALIDKGAEVNVQLPYKDSLLIRATEKSDLKAVEFLLKKGASIEPFNDFGDNVVTVCSKKGSISIMDQLIKKGGDVNSKNKSTGKSALHISTKNTNVKMVELLVLKGADVNIKDKDNNTPIVDALPEVYFWWQTPQATEKQSYLARYFLDRGADIKAYETDNFFVAMLADTLNLNNPGYARNFMFSRVNNDWDKLDARRVDAVLSQFATIPKIDEKRIDQLLLKLLHPDINYKNDVEAARHSAHLRSWDGVVNRPGMEMVEAEGWWMHVYPPLKIKSLILSLNKINQGEVDSLKEFLIPKKIAIQKIKDEIASQMSTYYSQRHHDMMRFISNQKFKDEFKSFEAKKYAKEIVKAPIGKEFAIASGFPGHAIYMSFRKTDENNVSRVVYNLGAGLNNHIARSDGKIYPHIVRNIDIDHFLDETPKAIGYLKGIIDAKLGLTRDRYAPIYKDIDGLGGELVTENIPGIPQKRQLVGNCVLKNNNAATRNRMDNDLLFKYLKEEEKKFADEISKIDKTIIDKKERDKDVNSFKYIISVFNQNQNIDKAIENTLRFLEKKNPGKSEVANQLREPERIAYYLQNLNSVLRDILMKQSGAYLMLNTIAQSRSCGTLKIVIEPYSPQKKQSRKLFSGLSIRM
jgi:uncharacterized protein